MPILITSGEWSDVGLPRVSTEVSGYCRVQEADVKTQYSFSRRGLSGILLQVKDSVSSDSSY